MLQFICKIEVITYKGILRLAMKKFLCYQSLSNRLSLTITIIPLFWFFKGVVLSPNGAFS